MTWRRRRKQRIEEAERRAKEQEQISRMIEAKSKKLEQSDRVQSEQERQFALIRFHVELLKRGLPKSGS